MRFSHRRNSLLSAAATRSRCSVFPSLYKRRPHIPNLLASSPLVAARIASTARLSPIFPSATAAPLRTLGSASASRLIRASTASLASHSPRAIAAARRTISCWSPSDFIRESSAALSFNKPSDRAARARTKGSSLSSDVLRLEATDVSPISLRAASAASRTNQFLSSTRGNKSWA